MKTFEEAIETCQFDDKLTADLLDCEEHMESSLWIHRMESLLHVAKQLQRKTGDDAIRQCLHMAFSWGKRIGMEMEKP